MYKNPNIGSSVYIDRCLNDQPLIPYRTDQSNNYITMIMRTKLLTVLSVYIASNSNILLTNLT